MVEWPVKPTLAHGRPKSAPQMRRWAGLMFFLPWAPPSTPSIDADQFVNTPQEEIANYCLGNIA
jgi:hypothetical protein